MKQASAGRARIALADDHADVRLFLGRLLERLGYEVCHSASNGAELLEACRDSQIDVVLVDLDMPVLDGLATAEEVTRLGIPAILMSGHPDLDNVVVDAEPFVATLTKPVGPQSLASALELALARRG